MSIRIAINGFGRIGRSVFRILADSPEEVEIVAINDIGPRETLTYLLKYDTVMGKFGKKVHLDGDDLVCDGQRVSFLQIKNLEEMPWEEMKIDFVIESTGVFRHREIIEKHLKAGAQKVLLTVPAKDAIDATIVLGVNDFDLTSEAKLISNASCTTNCLAPVAKVLHQKFGIRKGYMTTIHAYTNDQRLADIPHKDFRRARAASENIIPTTTGAAKAVGKVIPDLDGKLDGIAMRIPLPVGSVVDLVAELEERVDKAQINKAMKEASEGDLKGILEYCEDPIVSSDIIGNPHSSIFDSLATRVLQGNFVKIVSWYDNEWGYSNRVVDLMKKAHSLS